MSNRYKTPGEIAGVKRRNARYRDRLREAGMKPRQYWVTEEEHEQIARIIKHWRGKVSELSSAEREAADILIAAMRQSASP